MGNIFKRILEMARAEGAWRLRRFGDMLFGDLEKKAYDFRAGDRSGGKGPGENGDRTGGAGASHSRTNRAAPRQVVEDLAVFNLTFPSTWEQVRKARNREIKKYHSDMFVGDPEKYRTSKEIMQIYNAAYDRLKSYYMK
jgi:hypothetical protein